MWHFGTDSLSEYTGEKFERTWEDGEHALLRIYSKDMKDGNGMKIRKECQEYPGIRLDAGYTGKVGHVTISRTLYAKRNHMCSN